VTPNGGQYTILIDLNGSKTNYTMTELDLRYVIISLIGPDNNVWWIEDNNAPQQNNETNFNAWTNSHTFPSP
jgi:hypothetical protein